MYMCATCSCASDFPACAGTRNLQAPDFKQELAADDSEDSFDFDPSSMVNPDTQRETRSHKKKTTKRGRKKARSKIWRSKNDRGQVAASDADDEDSPCEGFEVSKTPTGSSKDKLPKKAKVKAACKPKAAAVEPKSRAKAKAAAAKPKGRAKAKAAAAKPKVRGKAKVLAVAEEIPEKIEKPSKKRILNEGEPEDNPGDNGDNPERVYGCSRCRYAAKGCITCKNPVFKPRGPRKAKKKPEGTL